MLRVDLCDKACFAHKFDWLAKRTSTASFSPVKPKVTPAEQWPAACSQIAQEGVATAVPWQLTVGRGCILCSCGCAEEGREGALPDAGQAAVPAPGMPAAGPLPVSACAGLRVSV